MSNFNQQFDIATYFCAGDDGNGGIQRYAKAKISNYYIKMGTYQDDNPHTVTFPDGLVKAYSYAIPDQSVIITSASKTVLFDEKSV